MTEVLTMTGQQIDLLNPEASDVDLQGWVLPLARLARFSGHTSQFYSVAQHSVFVAGLVSDEARPYALLHDMHEAVTGDITQPVQEALERLRPGFQENLKLLQSVWDRVIHEAAGLIWPVPAAIKAEVKRADIIALATERRDLLPDTDQDWNLSEQPAGTRISPLEPDAAAALFVKELNALIATGQIRPPTQQQLEDRLSELNTTPAGERHP